ncbi:lactonase family protein [Streptomyces sp. RTd22]|uniref:lactonase family protein n=1 Tax=Streptomyces sp. RTd22 TaxID=1841249 RepID=UPI0007C4C076|nr:lactonase family protein [Streptomyces sp. RTd22]
MTRPSGEHTVAYVGSRTTPARNGQGKGIEVYDVGPGAPGAHRWTLLQTVELDNPTFLAVDHTRRYLYAVHGDLGHVSAFRIEPGTGRLGDLGSQETGGRNPAHLAVDPSNRFLVVANHSSGSVASLPLREDGRLGPVTDLLLLPGEPGPHRAEQTGAKPHHVPFAPDGRFLAVPDKGLDRVFTLALDAMSGKLSFGPVPHTATREMAGPRHICFHPTLPYAYTIDELRSTVTTYRWDAVRGALEGVQTLPSTPPSAAGDSRGGEIAVSPDGRFVYASNRGGAGDGTPGGPEPDTIGVFAVSAADGTLRPVEWQSTGGIRPRFFCFGPDGRRLFAANERSHTITTFDVDADSGALRPSGGALATGSPVCIVFSRPPSDPSGTPAAELLG